MSAERFTKALEPRNWFDMDAQMAGWTGTNAREEAESATQSMQSAAAAERAKADKSAADAAAKAEQERIEALKKKKGLAGTILTSGLGVTEDAATKYATLLGR